MKIQLCNEQTLCDFADESVIIVDKQPEISILQIPIHHSHLLEIKRLIVGLVLYCIILFV